MNCANHPDIAVSQYCRTCGKPLCAACVRSVQGVTYCEQCLAERLGATQPPVAAQAPPQVGVPYVAPQVASGPNPALAGILAGFFPFGVGAVYTGQYAKGLAHLVVMTLLIWGETVIDNGGLNAALGFGIAFFYVYQIIDAVKSAHAIRAGLPAPDPFGLASMFGGWESSRAQSTVAATSGYATSPSGTVAPQQQTQRIPTAAIVLIGLGCLFLLRTAGIFDYDEDLILPVVLIALGVFMLIRRKNAIEGIDQSGRRIRMRLTGPAVLITIGTLILIEHLHGPSFHRTWPIILLMIGLVRLLEMNNRPTWPSGGQMPMPPDPASTTNSPNNQTNNQEVNRG